MAVYGDTLIGVKGGPLLTGISLLFPPVSGFLTCKSGRHWHQMPIHFVFSWRADYTKSVHMSILKSAKQARTSRLDG